MDEEIESLRTVRDFIRWGASRFGEHGLCFGHGTDNALDEAAHLVLHALHLPVDLPPDYLDSRLTPAERESVNGLLRRRIEERKPAAYLTGSARFAGLNFYVNESVLVPRSPIAELIEQAFSPWLGDGQPRRILDLCTGSGCIAVALAYSFPGVPVDAVELSEAALEVARRNVDQHDMAEQVELLRSDLFDSLVGRRYDLIVSNPPYVGAADMANLPDEYRHEPAFGLEAGEDGLAVVGRILREASGFLAPDGIIVVEVGRSAQALLDRYPDVPFLWLEFERGGDGVFLLTAEQLQECRSAFEAG